MYDSRYLVHLDQILASPCIPIIHSGNHSSSRPQNSHPGSLSISIPNSDVRPSLGGTPTGSPRWWGCAEVKDFWVREEVLYAFSDRSIPFHIRRTLCPQNNLRYNYSMILMLITSTYMLHRITHCLINVHILMRNSWQDSWKEDEGNLTL